MSLAPRTDEAINFLQKLRPSGPWVLTAILPNRGQISTQTFTSDQEEEMVRWIDNFQNIRNIYYTLNTVHETVTSKPTKEQIVELYALHCDCDPRVGEDFNLERQRILNKLQSFVPSPIIIDSGGGYQAIFLLQEPIALNGNAEEYEGYNRQLELLLDGDHCFNVDRILRLPGTVNVPDEKKIKKGRLPTLSKVIQWAEKYPLSLFTKIPSKIQQLGSFGKEALSGGGEKIKLSGNIEPIYVEDLPDKNVHIKDNIKVLIVQGNNPDNVAQYPSRSEALWAVVCGLARAGASDEIIAGIILNRDNGISASVLDNKRPERYAAKQIQDAREEVEEPILRKLNSKHAVILNHAGTCRIISEVFEPALERTRISFSTFTDFKNSYLNLMVQVATDKDQQAVMRPAGDWWVKHPKRRQYETIVFAPGREIPEAYNLWRGFTCDPIEGDCSLYLQHVRKNICQDNEEYYNYIISWMARCVQQPDCPGEVAIVLRGEMGTGKSLFAKIFGSLFGRHFLQVSDSRHLVGNFNSHLRDCLVLFSDEAFFAGDKKHESVLKALVTEENLALEAKGVDLISCPNYCHIIMASNAQWVVPAGSNERRFFVLDVGADKMQDKKYFAAIVQQINSGGKEALLHLLLNINIKEFEVRNIPKTGALQDQKQLSYSSEESWFFEKLVEGRLLYEHNKWEREIQKAELQNDYIAFMTRIGVMRKSSPTVLGKFLGRVCPGGMPHSYQRMAQVKETGQYGENYTVSKRVYFYTLPSLEECRSFWDKHHGGPFKWNPPLEQGDQIEMKPEEPEAVFR